MLHGNSGITVISITNCARQREGRVLEQVRMGRGEERWCLGGGKTCPCIAYHQLTVVCWCAAKPEIPHGSEISRSREGEKAG